MFLWHTMLPEEHGSNPCPATAGEAVTIIRGGFSFIRRRALRGRISDRGDDVLWKNNIQARSGQNQSIYGSTPSRRRATPPTRSARADARCPHCRGRLRAILGMWRAMTSPCRSDPPTAIYSPAGGAATPNHPTSADTTQRYIAMPDDRLRAAVEATRLTV